MRGLDGMIRLNRFTLDEKRREQAELLRQVEAIEAEEGRIAAEMEAEKAMAAEALAQANFGAYAQGVRMRREALGMARHQLEAALETKREEIAEVFEELKRYETLKERQQAAAAKEADRREQTQLDEIGQQRHRRHKEGQS